MEAAWQFLIEKLSGLVPDISPFWFEWLPLAVLVIILACVIGWFFSPLRSFAGAVVLAVIAALYAFRKGEGTATERYKKEIARLKAQKQRQPSPPSGGWFW